MMNDIITQLVTIFSAALTTQFKKYYYGRPIEPPPRDSLPYICFYPISTVINNSGTARDKAVFNVGIEVIDSIKRYMTTSGTDTMSAQQQLVKWVEEEQSSTYKTNTVMQLLRDNISVTNKVYYCDEYNIEYTEPLENDIIRAKISFMAEYRPLTT